MTKTSTSSRAIQVAMVAISVATVALYLFGRTRQAAHSTDPWVPVANIRSAPAPDSLHVLWIGNSHSYHHEVPRLVAQMVPDAQPPLWFEPRLAPGVTIGWHYKSGGAIEAISSKKWDWVVVQPQSTAPAEVTDVWQETFRRIEATAHAQGSQTLVWIPWARDPNATASKKLYEQSWAAGGFEGFQARLNKSVRSGAKSSVVAPVGPAFHRAFTAASARLWEEDGSHSSAAGAYLAALVTYACVYQADPATVTFDAELPSKLAADLRTVASEVTQAADGGCVPASDGPPREVDAN